MTPERWRQIEELYLAAIDLNGAERGTLLAQSGSEVRQEVEAMLAQSARSNLLDHPARENAPEPSAALPIGPGVLLGQYKIEIAIGAGGMGTVFRAIDIKLHRPVAIKFLSDDLADAAARRRFQREAQMALSLNHPHILTVYDVGEFDGRQYLVTEFIDGGTLRNWAQRQPRNWEDVAQLLTGVADALATAHEAGILHRDIKPDNILVTASGYAKLADFGLAKLEDAPALSATRTLTEEQTRKGMIIGTIAYMSPEQASGQPLDVRSDMFSFGVVLYELLAGRRPFRASTNLELLQRVIHAKPAPPGDGIPEPLRELVMKALEKDQADRYPSMRELVTALRAAQRPSGPSAAAPRKRPGRWIAAAAFCSHRGCGRGRVPVVAATPAIPTAFGVHPADQLHRFGRDTDLVARRPHARLHSWRQYIHRPGDVHVKLLPDGDPVQLTHDGGEKMGPVSFSPDGSRIAYTRDQWETWSVPVLGGEPARLLADTEGLSWTNSDRKPYRVMYSASTGAGLQMGIFTATESRSEQRTVYMPPLDGMAHRSFLSPDGKWVIIVEMGMGWLPCRLVPFDGSSAGRRVGPEPAQCTFAGWTPDGKWMYFSANPGDRFHISTATIRERQSRGVRVSPGVGAPQHLSDSGSVVSRPGHNDSGITAFEMAGTAAAASGEPC